MILPDRHQYGSPVVRLFSVCAGGFRTNLRRIRIIVIMFAESAHGIMHMGSIGCGKPLRQGCQCEGQGGRQPAQLGMARARRKNCRPEDADELIVAEFSEFRCRAGERQCSAFSPGMTSGPINVRSATQRVAAGRSGARCQHAAHAVLERWPAIKARRAPPASGAVRAPWNDSCGGLIIKGTRPCSDEGARCRCRPLGF
jgi:hypothetical protein